MKKIIYTISDKHVWGNVYDTKLGCIMNFWGVYKGTSNIDCIKWAKKNKIKIKKDL